MGLRSVIYRTHGSHILFRAQHLGTYALDQREWPSMPPVPSNALPEVVLLNNNWISNLADVDSAHGVSGFEMQEDGRVLVQTYNPAYSTTITASEYASIVEATRLFLG